jgi:hypothetical protein
MGTSWNRKRFSYANEEWSDGLRVLVGETRARRAADEVGF